jgi:hypothetical protein
MKTCILCLSLFNSADVFCHNCSKVKLDDSKVKLYNSKVKQPLTKKSSYFAFIKKLIK